MWALAAWVLTPTGALAGPQRPGSPEALLQAIEEAQSQYRLPEYYTLARRFLTRYPQHPAKDAVRSELALQLIADNLTRPESPGAAEARALLAAQEKEAQSEGDRFDAALLLLKFGLEVAPEAIEAAADRVLARYPQVEGREEVQVWAIARLLELNALGPAARRAEACLDQVDPHTRGDYERLIRRARLVGQPAPLEPGEKKALALQGKKLVVLDFWASWCRPCLEAQPALQAFQAAHGKDGLWIVGVNLDEDPEDAARHPSPLPQLRGHDTGIEARFGIHQLPTYVVIDANGRIVETELSGDRLYDRLLGLLGKVGPASREGEAQGRESTHQGQER